MKFEDLIRIYTIPRYKYKKERLVQELMSRKDWMSVQNDGQRISRTNYYHVSSAAPYSNPTPSETEVSITRDFFEDYNSHLATNDITKGQILQTTPSWYQVYEKGDYHGYHRHPGSNYSCVLFVNLPDPSGATEFIISGNKYTPIVKEGQIITFPSALTHRSPLWELDEKKIIISWNMNL